MSNTNSNTVPDNLKKLEELYEKLERDPNLEKAFLEDKSKFSLKHKVAFLEIFFIFILLNWSNFNNILL